MPKTFVPQNKTLKPIDKLARIFAEIDADDRKDNIKAYSNGFRFKVEAWVHPSAGDDYMVIGYHKTKPTDASVKAMLKKRGSEVLTDYQIVTLLKP